MTENKKIDWRIGVTAILGLVAIECIAIPFGINGTLRTFIVGAICTIAGLSVPNPFKK